MSAAARAVAIDWGTTHRRGWLLDAEGRPLAFHGDEEGMLAARGRFPQALRAMLQALGAGPKPVPVLMSGMVGSAQGWVEVPYVPVGAPLTALIDHLQPLPFDPGWEVRIVPGCVQRPRVATTGDATGQAQAAPPAGLGPDEPPHPPDTPGRDAPRALRIDVMRGEETQLLGAIALGQGDGWVLLPGTHSKWVRLHQGVIAEFATFLTGELYALLGTQGTLAAALAADDGGEHAQAFAQGLHDAQGVALSLALFGCRARVVAGALDARAARAYLSGLLIGAEWDEIRRRGAGRLPGRVAVIGAPALAHRHAQAAEVFGTTLDILDAGAATVAGLARLLGLRR